MMGFSGKTVGNSAKKIYILKEWPKRLYKHQIKMKIKIVKEVTLRNRQAPWLHEGRKAKKLAGSRTGLQELFWWQFQLRERISAKLEAIQNWTGGWMKSEINEEYGSGSAPSFGVSAKKMYLLILEAWNLCIKASS